MVKLLVCGDLEDEDSWHKVVSRVNELQASAHGPFDLLILAGKVFGFSEGESSESLKSIALPIPTCALMKCSNRETLLSSLNVANLTLFGPLDFGVITIAQLNIAYLNSSSEAISPAIIDAAKAVSASSAGFDILVTAEWPRDMHHFMEGSDLRELKASSIGLGGAKLSAAVSSILKPRYHFVAGKKQFFQRAPYRNEPTTPAPCTRLISICEVSGSKDKKKKWLHALSLSPISTMSASEFAEVPPGTTECPYVEVSQGKTASGSADSLNPAKRFKVDEQTGVATGKFFFGNMGVQQQQSQQSASGKPSNTVFIGGLLRETVDDEVRQALAVLLSGQVQAQALVLKRPPGKAFAFVEFPSVELAKKVVEAAARRGGGGLKVGGRTLNVGWAKEKEAAPSAPSAYCPPSSQTLSGFVKAGSGEQAAAVASARPSEIVYERELVPPTADSKVLFIGGLPLAVAIVPLQALAAQAVPLNGQSLSTPQDSGKPAEPAAETSLSAVSPADPSTEPTADSSDVPATEAELGIEGVSTEKLLVDILNGICRGEETASDHPPAAEAAEAASSASSAASTATSSEDSFVVKVNHIPGKTFAFVEMDSYESAMRVVSRSIKENFKLLGKVLTIGWAKGDPNLHDVVRSRYMPPPMSDSRVLFVGQLSSEADDDAVRELLAGQGVGRADIVAIRRPAGKDYAFVELSSAELAHTTMRRLCEEERVVAGRRVSVGWAKGKPADANNSSADCWFCLASPSLKAHLVLSVADSCYVALPRGGVTDLHVMISPIECVPSRLHLSAGAKEELGRYQECIEKLFNGRRQASVRFERALRTKGSRDHMQIHMVPLPFDVLQSAKAFQVFMNKATNLNIKFNEIQDKESSVDEVVLGMEGGPYQEYFYVELPMSISDSDSSATYRRFVYVKDDKEGSVTRFPMSFGLELAAEILGKPERSFWKNCIVSDDEERFMANAFRDSFSPFDFTLNSTSN